MRCHTFSTLAKDLFKEHMKNKKYVPSLFIIVLTGLLFFAVQAQQKKDTFRANFSGEWKTKESISMGGNIVCSYDEGDRMLSKTMKIAQQADYLTIEIASPSTGSALVTSQEKLTFDGKESQINHDKERGKKFTVKFSVDGKTMTINSIVHLTVATPYNVSVLQQGIVYVKEVWNLSNDGKSIIVQANAKSNIFDDERSWKTVFEKAN